MVHGYNTGILLFDVLYTFTKQPSIIFQLINRNIVAA